MTKSLDTKIAVIETEVKYLKESFEKVIPKIDEMHETFIRGDGKIKSLNKEVFGNGDKGLKADVKEINITLNKATGALDLVKWVIGVLGLANVFVIIKMWLKG